MLHLAHIINPVKVKDSSDLYHAQAITFESMLLAKGEAITSVKVDLFTTQYEEDREIIPQGFAILPNLKRSVLHVNPNLGNRKLPLIKDILQTVFAHSDAEYFVYTNVDIGLMPSFYDFVVNKINKGHDALVVNRRRLKGDYTKVQELPQIYTDLGHSHPGFDCFVFKRELLEKFVLGDICVGVSFIGVAMAYNIFTWASNPLYVPDKHLTFHIGTDVLVPRNNSFYQHNRMEFNTKVRPALKAHFDLKKFPYAALPFCKRALKWILNPSLSTMDYLSLEGKSFFQKCKTRLDEIRWRILQK
ncbi:MAG: hypothetical protein ISR01_06570 [Chitinophagales bacterium]|nr:hypothetical protein [Chitinophagales bacterium]